MNARPSSTTLDDSLRESSSFARDDRAGDWPSVTLMHGSFAEVGERVAPASLDGLLADLGVSSLQLGDAARGFSFQAEGPLDMRMNPMSGETAEWR